MINYIKNKLFGNIDTNNLLNVLVKILVFASVLIVIVFGFYFLRFSNWLIIPNGSQEKWGQFGDFVGGTLNPLLSFLGLIALLITIALQSKELKLSRKELKQTRKELKKSAKAQDEIKNTQIKQQFENTFFALLDQHNKALENLVNHDIYYETIRSLKSGDYSQGKTVENKIHQANIFIMKYDQFFGSYFRILYQLLKFIIINVPNSNVKCFNDFKKGTFPILAADEKMYSNMVRAFLNHDITLLLAVNCYCDEAESDDYWGYKLLVERYAFFEHLASTNKYYGDEYYSNCENGMGLRDDIKNYYEKSAFGNNKFFLN